LRQRSAWPPAVFTRTSVTGKALRQQSAGAFHLIGRCKVGISGLSVEECRRPADDRRDPAVAARRKNESDDDEALAEYVSFDGEQLPREKLSERKYQTLCMLASGKRLTDVANALSLSVKTVSGYRTCLLEKMKLNNKAELTFYVMTKRLVDLNPAMTG
jgi:DNA-binding CsgD family transcriptional regulator